MIVLFSLEVNVSRASHMILEEKAAPTGMGCWTAGIETVWWRFWEKNPGENAGRAILREKRSHPLGRCNC